MNLIFERLRYLARRLLISIARDRTQVVGRRRSLIIAPHPDDETLGCGAVIARASREGTPVTVLVIGDGSGSHTDVEVDTEELSRSRRAELTNALAELGAAPDGVVTLDFPDSTFARQIDPIAKAIAAVVRDFQPDDVYVTSADERHPDHRAACLATARAVVELPNPPSVFEYGVWLWSDWPLSKRFVNGSGLARLLAMVLARCVESVRVVDVRDIKHRALSAHLSQLGEVALPSRVADYDPPAGSPALPAGVISRALDDPELFFKASSRRLRSLAAKR